LRRLAELDRAKLHRFLMAAPFAIVWLEGPDHRVILSNPKHREFIGGKNIAGKTVLEGLPELAGQPIMQVLDRVYETGTTYSDRAMLMPLERDGQVVDCWFDLVYEALRDERGNVEGILGCAVDVTADVLARREIESARRSAESANRAKDEFLAMLGHELRNPLSPIVTALQLLRMRGGESNEIAVIDRQVGHLLRLVDDLLDISRITRGKVELRKERVELAAVVVRGVEMASPLLEQRRQHLDLRIAPEGLLVEGDADRLAQVVSNLLTNAAKYSERDTTIHVAAGREGKCVRLRVRDEGVGIAPDMQERIFDLFVQEHQSLDRSKGGLGLGLAIVKSLVQLHNGTVSAHSQGVGEGSEFIVDLPLASGAEDVGAMRPANRFSLARIPGPEAGSNRVLVVDDNVDAADTLADILRDLGYEIRTAYDGPSALKVAKAFRPNVCLVDIGLPVMDGYELTQRLRDSADLPENARIVAITGYGQDVDRRRSIEAGFNDHLVKPVSLDVLTRAILN
jgi:signal transduction histidine kinase